MLLCGHHSLNHVKLKTEQAKQKAKKKRQKKAIKHLFMVNFVYASSYFLPYLFLKALQVCITLLL